MSADLTFIRRFQDHLAAKLLSEPLLQYVAIVEQRKQILVDVAARTAPYLALRNGKTGVGILINLPSADPADADIPGAQMDVLIWLDILSKDDINLVVSNGANFPAEGVLTTTWLLLNQWLNQGLGSGNLFVDGFDPIEDRKGAYGYRLQLRLRMAQDQPDKVSAPVPDLETIATVLFCRITNIAEGALCYYTLDGSFPGPGNAAALLYDNNPFDVSGLASGATILAACYKNNTIGSDVWAITIP